MSVKKATDEQILQALQDSKGIRSVAAQKIGVNVRTLLNRIQDMQGKGISVPGSTYQHTPNTVRDEFEFTPLPDDDVPIEELIEQRKRKFLHKREHEEASSSSPYASRLQAQSAYYILAILMLMTMAATLRPLSAIPPS